MLEYYAVRGHWPLRVVAFAADSGKLFGDLYNYRKYIPSHAGLDLSLRAVKESLGAEAPACNSDLPAEGVGGLTLCRCFGIWFFCGPPGFHRLRQPDQGRSHRIRTAFIPLYGVFGTRIVGTVEVGGKLKNAVYRSRHSAPEKPAGSGSQPKHR